MNSFSGVLRFFGHLGHWKPNEMLARYLTTTHHLLDNVERDDLSIVGITIDTLGHIAATNNGKLALNATGEKMDRAICILRDRLVSFPTPLRVRALNCFENLLRLSAPSERAEDVTRKWFYLLGDIPMDLVLKYAKNPFLELRLSGMGIINAISVQLWGQECIKNTPGFSNPFVWFLFDVFLFFLLLQV